MMEEFTQDHQPQTDHARQARGRNGADGPAVDADLLQLADEVRATDAYVGKILRAENDAWLEASADGIIARITAASQPYLTSGNKIQPPAGLRLAEDGIRQRSLLAQRFQHHWRSAAALAAVMLIALTLSIIYSPKNLPEANRPGSETVAGENLAPVDHALLENEMAALWEDLDDFENDIFTASYHLPIAEYASYWALTELETEISNLEADFGAF